MASIIEMPKLSDTMTVGTLVSWLKKEGEPVATGDMIAEIETDKATMELECFDDGVILKQLVKPGDQVEVGAPICAIGQQGESFDPSSIAPAKEGAATEGVPEEKESAEETKRQLASEAAEPTPEVEPAQPATPDETPAPQPGKRLKASPLARKIAAREGINLEGITGSGPGGRIVKADVLAAKSGGAAPSAAASSAPPPQAAPAAPVSGGSIAEAKKISLSNMRETIARRLVESKTQIPHFYLEMEVDAAPLQEMRAGVNAVLADRPPEQGGGKVSINDFIMKACAEALRQVPTVNCSWQGKHIEQHPSAHVSFAVAIEEGLITPIVRDAQNKSVRQISGEVKSLAWKAKNKKLKPEEFTGGTFCVSNMGMFGVERFNAIINPPNAAILAVGATRKIPVVTDDDQIVIGHRMSLVLSCDHRVVDGATGAKFLAVLKELLETPALMMV